MQYADDFVVYCEERKLNVCIQKMSTAMNMISSWCDQNCLNIFFDKTCSSIFTRHRLPNYEFLNLGNHNIRFQKEVRYLGMILDQKLSWKSHIKYVTGKCEKGINVLRFCTKVSWGC